MYVHVAGLSLILHIRIYHPRTLDNCARHRQRKCIQRVVYNYTWQQAHKIVTGPNTIHFSNSNIIVLHLCSTYISSDFNNSFFSKRAREHCIRNFEFRKLAFDCGRELASLDGITSMQTNYVRSMYACT